MLFDVLGLSHIYSNDIHTHNIFACVSYSQLMNIFCRELTSVGQLVQLKSSKCLRSGAYLVGKYFQQSSRCFNH